MVRDTSFREATECFQNFLMEQGLSPDLLWVFREDVVYLPNRLLINTANSQGNNSLAEALYKLGQERDFGVALNAFALLSKKQVCYIELPENDLDAQYRLMGNGNVKYSMSKNLQKAEAVNNFTLWAIYKLRDQIAAAKGGVSENLPSGKFI